MAKINSKSKGKRGELEAAHALGCVFGMQASRGVQYQGTPDSPDIRTEIDGVHFEVKRTEHLRLYEAMEQAENDSAGNIPVVLHRRNRKPWVMIVRLNDMPELCRILASKKENGSNE